MKNRRGFTLIEILIASVIFVVVIGIAASLLIGAMRTSEQNRLIIEVQSNTRKAIDRIVSELREAAAPMGTEDAAILEPSLASGQSRRIVFSRPDTSVNSQIFDPSNSSQYNRVEYSVENNTVLKRKVWSYDGTILITDEKIVEVPPSQPGQQTPNSINLLASLRYDPAMKAFDESKILVKVDVSQTLKSGAKPQSLSLEQWAALRQAKIASTGGIPSTPAPTVTTPPPPPPPPPPPKEGMINGVYYQNDKPFSGSVFSYFPDSDISRKYTKVISNGKVVSYKIQFGNGSTSELKELKDLLNGTTRMDNVTGSYTMPGYLPRYFTNGYLNEGWVNGTYYEAGRPVTGTVSSDSNFKSTGTYKNGKKI